MSLVWTADDTRYCTRSVPVCVRVMLGSSGPVVFAGMVTQRANTALLNIKASAIMRIIASYMVTGFASP